MDLTALNRSPIGAAARAVGQATYGALNGVATTAGTLSSVIFRARTAWQLLMNRTRFDYRAEVGDPATNSIVGAVVGWIARNFPDAPVRIVREGTQEIAYMPAGSGAGYMLRLLERPNTKYSGVLQWRATVYDFIRGDAYWLKVRNGVGRVVELWWLPAFMIEPRWDERDRSSFITYYEYTVDGVAWKIRPNDVIHFRNGINPRNPRKGVDQLGSLFREIFTDDEAANFTAALMKNLGVPGVIIAPANTVGGAAMKGDPQTIKDRFKETFGGDRRGEPMVLTGPSEIKVLSFSPQEMDLKALRRIPEERVSAVLGVPAGVAQLGAGLDRNTFTNYGEARGAAYTEGVIPLHRLIAAELEVQLLPEFVDTEREALDVWFDWTQVTAMAFAVAERRKSLETPASKGLMTRARYKKLTGEPVATDGSDDVYVMPNNFIEVPAGGNPPGGATRPALPTTSSQAQLTSSPEPLLLESTALAGEVRCEGCNRLLAEQAAPPYRIACRHCKAVTTSEATAAA